jgi:hypothetical protein
MIKYYLISSCELSVVLSTKSNQTVALECRVRSHRGVARIASDMA